MGPGKWISDLKKISLFYKIWLCYVPTKETLEQYLENSKTPNIVLKGILIISGSPKYIAIFQLLAITIIKTYD